MKTRFLALLLASALAVPAAAVDVRDAFTRRMDEGIAAYESGDFEAARAAFADARVMRPGSAEAELNLGLALSRLGEWEAADRIFSRLAESDRLRAEAHYNRGRAQSDAAREMWEEVEEFDQETQSLATNLLLESLDSFDAAIEARDGEFPEALHNRMQAVHLLHEIATAEPPPPPPPSEGEGEPEDSEDREDDEPGDDDQQPGAPQPTEGDEGEDEDGDPENGEEEPSDDPADGDPDEEGEGESDQTPSEPDPNGDQEEEADMETGPAPHGPDEMDEMSEEEARALLNLLGDDDVLRRTTRSRREAEKPW